MGHQVPSTGRLKKWATTRTALWLTGVLVVVLALSFLFRSCAWKSGPDGVASIHSNAKKVFLGENQRHVAVQIFKDQLSDEIIWPSSGFDLEIGKKGGDIEICVFRNNKLIARCKSLKEMNRMLTFGAEDSLRLRGYDGVIDLWLKPASAL